MMANEKTRVTFLGTRGSVPVCGEDFALYGGDTSCVLVRMGGEEIILDAGSGLMRAADLLGSSAHILITHPHIDHMLGLMCFPPLFDESCSFTIMTQPRQGLSAAGQVSALMRPPLWPVTSGKFLADVRFCDITEQNFKIGNVSVEVMESGHPGGCSLFRLSHGNTDIAYCTDLEHGANLSAVLETFAKDVSLLVYDAYFTDEEYADKRGWGHSTWREGVKLAIRCGAKTLVLTHHSPTRTDAELEESERLARQEFPGCAFAKCGMEIDL
jgi:phosphoribosyl 1,2-cyclic phosphodiesterase